MFEVKILQIKNIGGCKYSFMGWEYANQNGFAIGDYKTVFEYQSDTDDLETIYRLFNGVMKFDGHSLSVSDVVAVDGKMYYCDVCGWEEIEG